jgi:hypothetical protein
MIFERKIATLALELQVKDQTQIARVAPDMAHALKISENASAKKLSIFAVYPFRDAGKKIGLTVQKMILPACKGRLDAVESIEGESRFVRVRGWIFNPEGKNYPEIIRFSDNQGKVVGYALTGQTRQDVADAVDKKAVQSGYQGYLLADQVGAAITLQGETPSCQMQASVPVLLFSLTSIKPAVERATLGRVNVLPGNQWLGSDYARSVIDGLQIFGSHINSDTDVGSISLRIKRGDLMFYRSGPTGGHQFLEVSSSDLSPMVLPVSTEWTLLNFNSMILPEGEFIVKFSDSGAAWGEWSAIAVRKK